MSAWNWKTPAPGMKWSTLQGREKRLACLVKCPLSSLPTLVDEIALILLHRGDERGRRKKERVTTGSWRGRGNLTHPTLGNFWQIEMEKREREGWILSSLELFLLALLLLLHGQLRFGALRPPEGGSHRERGRRRRVWHLQDGRSLTNE